MKSKLSFDAEGHKYTLGGKVVPSVTQIINDVTKGEREWEGGTYSRDFGTCVHKTLELLDKGELGEYDERMNPYIKGWNKFMLENKVSIHEVELMHHSEFGFAGTIDRVVEIYKKYYILDIKTGKEYKEHPLQLAGYNIIYREYSGNNKNSYARAVVYLDENGYRFVEYNNKDDEEVFLSMFLVWQWKKGKLNGPVPKM